MGGDGSDVLEGGAGFDVIVGADGSDQLKGGPGDDSMVGGTGADRLEGDSGRDDLDGGIGSDFLSGGADDDEIKGELGDDNIDGGAGDDLVFAGPGLDAVEGGQGWDRCYDAESGNCDKSDPVIGVQTRTTVSSGLVRLELGPGEIDPSSVTIEMIESDVNAGVEFEITSTGFTSYFPTTKLTVPVNAADELTSDVEFYDPNQDLWIPYPVQVKNGNGSITVEASHFTRVKVAKDYREKSLKDLLGQTIIDGPRAGRTCIASPFWKFTEAVVLYDSSGSHSRDPSVAWIPDDVAYSVFEVSDTSRLTADANGQVKPAQPSTANFGDARLTPALREALVIFRSSSRNYRQLLIIGDGGFTDSAADLLPLAEELNRYGVSVTFESEQSTLPAPVAAFWEAIKSKRLGIVEETFDNGSDLDEDDLTDCEEYSGIVTVRERSLRIVKTNPLKPDSDSDGLPDPVEIATETRLSNRSGAEALQVSLPYGRRGRHMQADPTLRNSGGSMISDKFDLRSETNVFKNLPGEVGFVSATTKVRTPTYTICESSGLPEPTCVSKDVPWSQIAKDFGAPTKELNQSTLNESDWLSLAIGLYFNFKDSQTTYDGNGRVKAGVDASKSEYSNADGSIKLPKYAQGAFWASLNKEGKRLIWDAFGDKIILDLELKFATDYSKVLATALLIGLAVALTFYVAWAVAVVAGAIVEGAVTSVALLAGGITTVAGVSVASIALVSAAVTTGTVFALGVVCRGYAQLKDPEKGVCTAENIEAFDVMFAQLSPGIDVPALRQPYSGPVTSAGNFNPTQLDDLGRTNAYRINQLDLPPLDRDGLPLKISRLDSSFFTTKMIGRSRFVLTVDSTKGKYGELFWSRPAIPKSSVRKGFGGVRWKVFTQSPKRGASYETIRAKYPEVDFFDDFGNLDLEAVSFAKFSSPTLTGNQERTGADYRAALRSINLSSMEEAEAKFGVKLTWHHTVDGCGMLLVPFEIHNAFSHWGGRSAIDRGLRAC